MYKQKLLALLIAGQIFCPLSAFSHGVASNGGLSATASFTSSTGLSLNLSSTKATFGAASLGSSHALSIMDGQTSKTITGNQQLTPAQYVAAYQVLHYGSQALQLGALGNAVGGDLILNAALTQNITGLVIPHGVTLFDNVASTGNLNLSGSLINGGNFYAVTSNPNIHTASFSSSFLENASGGTISTLAPQTLLGSAAFIISNLSLQTSSKIVNAGTISVPGELGLIASSISNAGLITSTSGNLNLTTAALTNSGHLQALSGNLNIGNNSGNVLAVNNAGGVIAAGGNLSFQTLGGTQANLTVTGGALSAAHLYFTSPQGTISVNTDSITGGVNVSGGSAAVNVANGTLTIESNNLTGDPIFSDANGDLDLAGLFSAGNTFNTSGADFTALAGGNIYDSQGGSNNNLAVNTTSTSGAGGAITLEAGVTFNLQSGGYTVTGTTASGGSVNLARINFSTNSNDITVVANSGNANAGNITLGNLNTTADSHIAMLSGSQGTVTINNNININGGTVDIQTGNLVDNGSIASTATNGSVNIHSPGALTLSGNPENISVNPAGTGTITVSAAGANALTISSYTFSAGPNGSVILSANDPGGSVVFNDNAMLYVYGGAYTSVISPQVTFGQNSGILATGASTIDINAGSQNQNVTLPANSTALLSTNGGNVRIGPYATANLSLSTNANASSQLFVNGGNLSTYSNGGNTTIGNGVTLSSNANMTLNIDGGSLIDNGSIYSSAYAGNVSISSWNGNLTLAGTNPTIVLSGGGPTSLSITAGGPDHTVNINANYSFDGGAQGVAAINTANVNLAANTSYKAVDGSALFLNMSALTLGNNSTISADASGEAVNIVGPALTVTGPSIGSATIASTSGGSINLNQNSLQFVGGVKNASRLNFTGGQLNIGTLGNVAIGQGVTLNSNNNIDMTINGGNSLIDNGTIISTAVNGQINIAGNTHLTLAGTPNFISATGGGNSEINVIGYDAGLDIASSYVFDAGSTGSVHITAASGNLSLATGKQVAITGKSTGSFTGVTTTNVNSSNVIYSPLPAPLYIASQNKVPASAGTSITQPEKTNGTSFTPIVEPTSAAAMAERVYSWQTTMPIINNQIEQILDQKKLEEEEKPESNEFLASEPAVNPDVQAQLPDFKDPDPSDNLESMTEPSIIPVAFVPPTVPQNNDKELRLQGIDDAIVEHDKQTRIFMNKNHHMVLKHGELILNATKPTLTHIGPYTISTRDGAVALITRDRGVFRVCNLYDKHAQSVTVSTLDKTISIRPGQEIMVGITTDALFAVLNNDPVAYRQVSRSVQKDGQIVVSSEVSLTSLLSHSNLLCHVKVSTKKEDRAITNKIELMAACVMMSTSGHGHYVAFAGGK